MSIGIVDVCPTCYCNRCGYSKPETDFSLLARAQDKAGDENCLCLDCVDRLYRGQLGRDEIQGYVKEDRARLLRRTRNPDFEEMVGEGRWGRAIHHSEFITKLQRLLSGKLLAMDAVLPNQVSLLRIQPNTVDFICWMDTGYQPEFSIVHFNKDMQPIREQRGWRTVLLRLIKAGALSEEQVEKEFGFPSSPQQAKWWNKQLFDYRNNRTVVKD